VKGKSNGVDLINSEDSFFSTSTVLFAWLQALSNSIVANANFF
jgi:hypothetical protein